jgi:hypothetical protein
LNKEQSTKKKPRILLMGYPYFINRLNELGREKEFSFDLWPKKGAWRRWLAVLRADLIYLIGGDLRPNCYYRLALLLGKKMIIHWVGSDIREMEAWQAEGRVISKILLQKAEHWAEVDWTAVELTNLGVKALIVPLTPADFPEQVPDLPEKFVALTYLPPQKAEFYGEEQILHLAREFSEVTFLIVGSEPTQRPASWPPNMVSVGWVDEMSRFYPEITVLIRMTRYDGLSFMVLEALARGRHVIWSRKLSGVRQAGDYHSLRQEFKELYEHYKNGRLIVNVKGRSQVELHYTPEKVWAKIAAGFHEGLKR